MVTDMALSDIHSLFNFGSLPQWNSLHLTNCLTISANNRVRLSHILSLTESMKFKEFMYPYLNNRLIVPDMCWEIHRTNCLRFLRGNRSISSPLSFIIDQVNKGPLNSHWMIAESWWRVYFSVVCFVFKHILTFFDYIFSLANGIRAWGGFCFIRRVLTSVYISIF